MSAVTPSPTPNHPGGPSRLPVIACCVALVASALPIVGVAGIHIGALSPMTGFSLFGAGAILGGGLTLLLAVTALIAVRGGRDPQGRRLALAAIVLALGLFAMVAIGAVPSSGLPPINDITTDLANPPAFAADPAGRGRDMSYPPEFVADVRTAYPDLVSHSSTLAPREALARTQEVARELGWQERSRDDARLRYEASESTAVFQFVDDVVVRVAAAPGGGSKIDVRSKSRDGRGDLGANAARIRAFLAAF